MRLKLPERFSLSVPARKVVLLPNTHFFCRAIRVAAGATPAEAAAQVELALEAMAPFPLAQLYHGHFWRPGAKHACVFAAYRKRFPAEQVETWADAEAVLPAFASMLNLKVADSTTLLLWSEKNLTAIHWEHADDAPGLVIARELPPVSESAFADHAALRDTVLRDSGAAIQVTESTTAPVLDTARPGDDFAFHCDHAESIFTREQLDVLDVRDKDELANRRRARYRDLILWRVLLGCAATIVLCLVLEAALIGGRVWQKSRVARMEKQEPGVSKIMLAEKLATRIEELSTKRLRPFEMISMVSEKLPNSILFTSTSVKDLYTLEIEGQAGATEDLNSFQSGLAGMAGIEKVETKYSRLSNGQTKFGFTVIFKPSAFQTAPQS
jgi:hypothetical protein